ncbi:MAG TPA: nuclear transport factor 2 family protein [Allosphingosinicella sp.]|uniref:nuclear transport factor 2 family protein n=1 Tax=Allosphingosinicella sp. TaxID=2823234 RepID=UPI002ED7F47A
MLFPTVAIVALVAAQGVEQDKKDLLALERQWNTAVVERDVQALDRILADDFMLIWIDGSVTRKPQMLTGAKARRVEIDPFETEDVEVRVYGDTAVVTGRFSQTVRLGEQSETNRFAYTDVYRRTADGWRAVSAHATRIAPPKAG